MLILWIVLFLCGFKWWILCSYFDVKFGYVKLKLDMLLLLLNLHAWIVVIWIFIDFCSNWYNIVLLLLIVDKSMFKWSCCWFEMLLLLNYAMGIFIGEVVVWIVKMCWFLCVKDQNELDDDLRWISVLIWCLLWFWICFYVCNQMFKLGGRIWG